MPTRKSACRILGIDPGLNITGYGAIDLTGRDVAVVEAGIIKMNAKATLPQRLAQLHEDLTAIVAELTPDVAAVEKLYSHYAHPRTSILMGHARGVILAVLAGADLEVIDLPSTKVKRAVTGNGHASKQQVQKAVTVLCQLQTVPEPPDVADALAIALCASKQIDDDWEPH